jgi:hypothetical protein
MVASMIVAGSWALDPGIRNFLLSSAVHAQAA